MATVFPLAFITNPEILTVICCTHPHIQYMFKKTFRILSFLDFGNSAVTTRIISVEPQRCASFLKNVAILPLLYRRASSNKRSIRKRMREFHSPLLFTPTIVLSKTSSSRILNYLWTTPKLPLSFHNLQSPHKRDKNVSNFFVRSALKTDHQRGTFQCSRARCKTCPLILNTDRISRPKRSIQIADRFSSTSTYVIYCITCTFCKTAYIGETGRLLGDRFANTSAMLRKMVRTHPNQ